jgi:hypothetical protein
MNVPRKPFLRGALLLILIPTICRHGFSQQLEPRAYSPSPTGSNFAVAAYGYASGDVVFDAAIPITNASANINSASLGYVRTFGLFGRSASAGLIVPYVWGHVQGEVFEQSREVHRSGLADMPLRLTCNLLGGPALTPSEFALRKPAAALGFSLYAVAPTGKYDSSKLINIGSNRWSFKTELGFSEPFGHWVFEAYGGAWFYTTNEDFFGGHTRQQAPIGTVQGHVSYTIRPRLWVAADYTYYWGGRTTVDGRLNADLMKNSRFGLTAAVPLTVRQSLKFAWTKGAATRLGANFTTYTVAYQFLWF